MNINPMFWGKSGWKFLHYVAMAYPLNPTINEKKHYTNFIYSLQHVLPCEKCRQNFTKKLRCYDINEIVKNKKKFFEFFVDAHNEVNKMQKKKIVSYTFVSNNLNKEMLYQQNKKVYIILLLILIFILYKYYL